MGSLLIFPRGHFPEDARMQNRHKKHVATKTIDPAAIGTGALSLKGTVRSRFLPILIEELQYGGCHNAPNTQAGSTMLIRLKSSGEEKVIAKGETIFLKVKGEETNNPKILGFSDEKVGLQLTPLQFSASRAHVDVGYQSHANAEVEKGGEVVFEKGGSVDQNASYFQVLKDAKWWGCDELIRHYGGPEFYKYRDKHKIEFEMGDETYMCFGAQGDSFFWDNGKWNEGGNEEETGRPIVTIRTVSSKKLELEGWDETGFNSFKLVLTPEYRPERSFNLDHLPTSIRIRNGTQISCILNKRRILLKEGDWLVRTSKGWRTLNKVCEMDDYLNHKLRGDLFIFDKLEKEHGKLVVKGHLFDEMRTSKQSMTIPIMAEKKRAPVKKRKTKKLIR